MSALAVTEDGLSVKGREHFLTVDERAGEREEGLSRSSQLCVSASRRGRPCPTLEAVIAAAWVELSAGRPAVCPVCGGELAPRYGAHARAMGGRCAGCQTTLE